MKKQPIPISEGTYTDDRGNIRKSYPHNLVTVPVNQGISSGFLKPAEGIVEYVAISGGGSVRGGINWDGRLYRVVGENLIRVNSDYSVDFLGSVGGSVDPVSMDYSFDRLSISSNGNLFYYNSTLGLIQVTDPDLGEVIDHLFVDGYFLFIDDENVGVTELADPTAVNPLKYGSSEADPDPVVAALKINDEPYLINRYTIEAIQNIGGSGFPFAAIRGATVRRGAIGTFACCVFGEVIAFVGSGRNEPLSVWVTTGGSSKRIATREIDLILGDYDETTLSNMVVESRVYDGHQELYIHLNDIALVYDASASQVMGKPVWSTRGTGLEKYSRYLCRHFVWCYNQWNVGRPDTTSMGYLTEDVGTQWTLMVGWEFMTDIIYNDGNGVIVHELELVCLPGRVDLDVETTIETQYSLDGRTWSMLDSIGVGGQGERDKRLIWLFQGNMRDRRVQRFTGNSRSRLTFVRLNARLEALSV